VSAHDPKVGCIRVARLKKLKRPNLAISSFKKGQILKNEKKAK